MSTARVLLHPYWKMDEELPLDFKVLLIRHHVEMAMFHLASAGHLMYSVDKELGREYNAVSHGMAAQLAGVLTRFEEKHVKHAGKKF